MIPYIAAAVSHADSLMERISFLSMIAHCSGLLL